MYWSIREPSGRCRTTLPWRGESQPSDFLLGSGPPHRPARLVVVGRLDGPTAARLRGARPMRSSRTLIAPRTATPSGRWRAPAGSSIRSRSPKSRCTMSAAARAATNPSWPRGSNPGSHQIPATRSVRPVARSGARIRPTPVAVEERQDVVAPASLGLRDVEPPDVVESEEAPQEVAVPAQRVEGRDERHRRPGPAGGAACSSSCSVLVEVAWSSATMKRSPFIALDLDRKEAALGDEHRPLAARQPSSLVPPTRAPGCRRAEQAVPRKRAKQPWRCWTSSSRRSSRIAAGNSRSARS